MKIYLDMDGVLTDLEHRYAEKFGAFPEDKDLKRKHFWKNWKTFVDDHEFETLPKHPGAEKLLETVEKFRANGIQVEILSSSGGGYSHNIVAEQKKKWLRSHSIEYHANIVPGGSRKAEYASPWNILIDDAEHVVTKYRSAGGTAILHNNVDETIKKLHQLHLEWEGSE